MFDVALDDAAKDQKRDRRDNKGGKRQKRDEKYGHGGKKRFSKSGDAMSSGDLRGFSSKKMKKGPQRPGKARRAGARK
jgi:rRNA-processing protein EBP2